MSLQQPRNKYTNLICTKQIILCIMLTCLSSKPVTVLREYLKRVWSDTKGIGKH
jgi:hypothetical protein